ncbi:T9SS type B sorting domain-containing protein [Flavobacterium sp. RHBU_24]|uniref:T9SS type B sorting domain-containing protein n=1 Tax=Flavobacterium sp. RHBU_24 TaxID=3391185 RepID=UPI00398540E1
MKQLLTLLFLLCSLCLSAQEICDNALDDDGDGLIDINDPDCFCNTPVITSIIPNPSFEEYITCPYVIKQLHYCSNWLCRWDSTDYYNCGYYTPAILNTGLVPPPDGQAMVSALFFTHGKEYFGTCLNSPLLAGVNYQLTLDIASLPVTGTGDAIGNNGVINYGPVNITIFGNATCITEGLPTHESPDTYSTDWDVIGSAVYTPVASWGKLTISFTPPSNINSIMIGAPPGVLPDGYPDASLGSSLWGPRFFFDNLVLREAYSYIGEAGNFCDNNLVLTVHPTISLTPSATYQWYNNGIAITGATQPSYAVPATPANIGVYAVMITSGGQCYISPGYTISPRTPAPDATTVQPNCMDNTGTITITTPADEYSFDGGATWGTNPVATFLTGEYQIKVRYNSGCESYISEVYLSPAPAFLPLPTFLYTDPTCTVSGSITITNAGAAEFSFDGGLTWSTDPVLANVPEGEYILVYKDAIGCVSFNRFVHVDSPLPRPAQPDITVTQPTSCSDSTGSITIDTVAPQYSFDGGATWESSNAKSLLTPGTYDIRVINEYGCLSDALIVVINTPPGAPAAPSLTVTDPTCAVGTGGITITSSAAYYSFDGGITWVTQNSMAGLPPGNYNVAVKNAQGCVSPATAAYINPGLAAPLEPLVSVQQPDCNISTGVITVTSAAQEYSFDNGATWTALNTSPPLALGDYFIRIKNAAGCQSPPLLVTIAPSVPATPGVMDLTYCKDSPALPLTAIGSNLLWYNQPSGGIGTATAPLPQTAVPGTTTWYVSQSINGCESERVAITVTIIDILPPPEASRSITYCQGEPTDALTATGTGLVWYTEALGGAGTLSRPVPSSAVPGVYKYYVSQLENGCESSRTEIVVTILPTPNVPITETLITYKHNIPTLPLTATGTNIKWYNGAMQLLNAAPVPSSANIGTTVYYVSQAIDGCESPLERIVVTVEPNYIIISYPRYFTPNSDAYNEHWNIDKPENNVRVTIFIYDRYGKLITQFSAPTSRGWDGTLNGSPLPATDYWFKAVYSEYGVEKTFSSHFSLIR